MRNPLLRRMLKKPSVLQFTDEERKLRLNGQDFGGVPLTPKTRMDSLKHSEAICKKAVMDSPFHSWTVGFAENRIFGETVWKILLSNRAPWRLQNAWLPFRPNFWWCSRHLPWAHAFLHLIGGFLWTMNNHLNKTPSSTAIKLCSR